MACEGAAGAVVVVVVVVVVVLFMECGSIGRGRSGGARTDDQALKHSGKWKSLELRPSASQEGERPFRYHTVRKRSRVSACNLAAIPRLTPGARLQRKRGRAAPAKACAGPRMPPRRRLAGQLCLAKAARICAFARFPAEGGIPSAVPGRDRTPGTAVPGRYIRRDSHAII